MRRMIHCQVWVEENDDTCTDKAGSASFLEYLFTVDTVKKYIKWSGKF